MKKIALLAVAGLSGCVIQAPPERVYVQAPPRVVYQPAPSNQGTYPDYNAQQPDQVVSAYVDPPLVQPEPVLVEWAPPPMLVEVPPPQPYEAAVWTGGYWVWEGNWIWAHGRWSAPPQMGYRWVHPYYENRGGAVVFVNGFWAAPGVQFVQPSLQIHLAFAHVNVGVIPGPRPIGPDGVFIPPPPGSARGLIVPAPIGTAPAVVTGAPPIVHPGMRVHIENNSHNTTVINNVTNNVTIIAPAGSTANGQAVNKSVPVQAHLAAQLPPVVRAMAPEPVSNRPIPAYTPGRAPINLPAPQPVRMNNQAVPAPATQSSYGQAPQHQQPQQAQQPQSAPPMTNIPVQQHQQTPSQPDYNPQVQRRVIEPPAMGQPSQRSEPTQVMPVQRSGNPSPTYQEVRPVQTNQPNDSRMREEMERKAVPTPRVEQRVEQRTEQRSEQKAEQRSPRREKDERSKEKE